MIEAIDVIEAQRAAREILRPDRGGQVEVHDVLRHGRWLELLRGPSCPGG